jgi:Ribosomal protein L7/L12 C-terminal domain
MFAVLDFLDFGVICLILVVLFAGGGTAAYSFFKPSDSARLRRLEAKIDQILAHLGLEYKEASAPGGVSADVKALADDPSNKIAAIKLHREQTGVGLAEAKAAVEAYTAGRG